MILVNCQEKWNQIGDFRIIKIEYNPGPRMFSFTDPYKKVEIKIACNLSENLGLKKETQTAKLVMNHGFVCVLYDNNWVILLHNEGDTWNIVDRYDCNNRMPNASITSINKIKGVFVIIGSRIQLFKITKIRDGQDAVASKVKYQIKLIG